MSTHIAAEKGQIAETILLPGDPLRAKYIAETYLKQAECYNTVRGMLGFTGYFQGNRVSVQGTGMGIPSLSIYVNELIREYGVKSLIRVGTCGALRKDVHVRDVILAMTAATDSAINHSLFPNVDFAPAADFDLLRNAFAAGSKLKVPLHVGTVFSVDAFYRDSPAILEKMADYGVLAVEMESSALYTLAAKYAVQALSVLTVSDHVFTGEETSAEEREKTFNAMMQIALAAVFH